MANGSLVKVKSIAECSPWSILQYFLPALTDNQFLVFFLSGRLRQVLLFIHVPHLSNRKRGNHKILDGDCCIQSNKHTCP